MTQRPAVCLVNHSNGPGVDTGIDVWPERGGYPHRVYLGDDVIGEMAVMVGGATAAQVAVLRERADEATELRNRVAELEAEIEALRERIKPYDKAEAAAARAVAKERAKEQAA